MDGYGFLLPLNLWTRTELGQLLHCASGLCWSVGIMMLQGKSWSTVQFVMISNLIHEGRHLLNIFRTTRFLLVLRVGVWQSSWYSGLPYHRLLIDGTERWWNGSCQGKTKMLGKIAATVTISPSRPTNPLWLKSNIRDVKSLPNLLNCFWRSDDRASW